MELALSQNVTLNKYSQFFNENGERLNKLNERLRSLTQYIDDTRDEKGLFILTIFKFCEITHSELAEKERA